MAKYHITAKGNPGLCRATKRCPLGGENEHYSTKEEAQKAYEKEKAFDTLAKTTSSSHQKVLQKELNTLLSEREEAYDKRGAALSWVRARDGIGQTLVRNIPAEEYDKLAKDCERLDKLADDKAKELRAFKGVPKWESHFQEAHGLTEARAEMMESLNEGYSEYYFDRNIRPHMEETLDRYHAGERNYEENPLRSDRLLHVLSDENNGIMSHQQVYNVLVFPEKDLKPVLDRLGVKDVEVKPMVNGRENGLVYTVKDPYGETRSFVIYEDRNSDSLIINGRENWDPTNEDDPLPYAGTTKHEFFAEFGPGDYRQAAETLGYFLKAAQKGELESDEELVAKAEHRDWRAILSETVPGFAEWIEREERRND